MAPTYVYLSISLMESYREAQLILNNTNVGGISTGYKNVCIDVCCHVVNWLEYTQLTIQGKAAMFKIYHGSDWASFALA